MIRLRALVVSNAPAATILIRVLVGSVFVSEGIQKFLFPDQIGAGRFAKIGIPAPDVMGPFVGMVEIVCGAMVIAGLLTRVAAIPLIAVMLVAIGSTKMPILFARGFWAMAHEARTDWSMLLGSVFLVITGSGPWSVDSCLTGQGGSARTARK